MKIKVHKIFLLIVCTNVILLDSCAVKPSSDYPDNIGDIPYNPKTDNADFYLCNPNRIVQYYSVSTDYRGERIAMYDEIMSKYKYKQAYGSKSGFITIRFVVNCKGDTDRFRVFELDDHYQNTKFEPEMIHHLLDIVRSLDAWIPGSRDGQIYDSYFRITFKIHNSKIILIKP